MSCAIELGEVERLFVGMICEDVGEAHFRTLLRGHCVVEEVRTVCVRQLAA